MGKISELQQYYQEIKSIIVLSQNEAALRKDMLDAWFGGLEWYNALNIAAVFQDKQMIIAIKNTGFDFDKRDGNGNNALHSLYQFNKDSDAQIINLLQQGGTSFDAENYLGLKPTDITLEFDIKAKTKVKPSTAPQVTSKPYMIVTADGKEYDLIGK